jgi:BASS family bile acid:Na+ symporter
VLSFQQFFPLLSLAICILGWYDPAPLSSWKSSLPYLTALSLFFIGTTIRLSDWLKLARKPEAAAFGVVLQFIAAPLSGWLIIQAISSQGDQVVTEGVLLTAVVSSSALAILMTFIAGGDTPLSVVISGLGAIWSALIMPRLVAFLSHGSLLVETDLLNVLTTLTLTQLIPIALGTASALYVPSFVKMLEAYLGDIIALTILLILGITVSAGGQEVASLDPTLALSSLSVCILLLSVGFFAARLQGFTESECKSISFQTGIQNCGLSLSLVYSASNPVAIIIPATYLFIQSVTSTLLASYWRWRQQQKIRAALSSQRERMPLK